MAEDQLDRIDGLVVSSAVRWVRDELVEAGSRKGVDVLTDWGMDLIDLGTFTRPAWWLSAGHAARLVRAGLTLPLVAPGPRWLRDVAATFPTITQRAVWAGTVGDLTSGDGPRYGFAKAAEAKLDNLEAAWWDDLGDFAAHVSAKHPPGTAIQVANRCLDLCCEHRIFHIGKTMGPSSVYLLADGTTWEEGLLDCPQNHHRDARRFATEVIEALADAELLPPAGTLDVAALTDGTWALIEANPAWCAGWYGADPAAVLDCLAGAVDHDGGHPTWTWQIDPALDAAAARRPLLRTPVYGKPLGELVRARSPRRRRTSS